MPPRAHPLDNFLPRIAALGKADVRVFQHRFVRNHRVMEVEREPRHSRLQAQPIQGFHSDRQTVLRMRAPPQTPPQKTQMLAGSDDLRAQAPEMGAPDQVRGHRIDLDLLGGHIGKTRQRQPGCLRNNRCRVGSFDRHAAQPQSQILKGHLRAEDVFL